MTKFRRAKKLLLIGLVLLGVGIMVKTSVDANPGTPSCSQINFRVDGVSVSNFNDLSAIELVFNPSTSSYTHKEVTLEIIATVSVPAAEITDTNPPRSLAGYRFSYDPPDGDWINIDLRFNRGRVLGDGTTVTYQAVATVNPNINFTIKSPGDWAYELEKNDGTQLTGANSFCPQNDSGKRFSVGKDTSNVDPTATYIGKGCLNLDAELHANHFTCEVVSASGASEAVNGRLVDTENFCTGAGYEVDRANCTAAITNTGTQLGIGYHCMPCVNPNVTPQPEPTVPHMGVCVPGSTNPDQQCQRVSQLKCQPASFGTDAQGPEAVYRCLYTAKVVRALEACYPGTNECEASAISGPYYCKPNGGSSNPPAGTCQQQDLDVQCVDAQQCIDERGYPAGSICQGNHCFAPGSPENPTDPGPDNSPPTSNDFGIKNCPHFYTSESVAEYQTSRSSEDLVPCREAEEGTECTVPPTLSTDELAEANSCRTCIASRSSWTALGCINTTPEGLLASIIRVALGVVGGIALIRLIVLGYMYNFGREDQLKPTVQDILATLGGILLVLFSVLILRFIGVNVLDVVPPGFFGN